MDALSLPRRPRGRLSAAAEAQYQERRRAFCAAILEIRARLDFAISARGWCYLLEEYGLNADFIRDHGLTWINNLETGSGGRLDDPRHPDHGKAYVQDYLAEFGARKVEANALVTRATAGRELCRRAILKYVDDGEAVDDFEAATEAMQSEMQAEVAKLLLQHIGGAS